MMRYKHHCRSCGNIVCHPCSPDVANIYEMPEIGKQRVCNQCYWGQDPVYVTHKCSTSYEDDNLYESFSNLTSGVKSLSMYTPTASKSVASKLFPPFENNQEILKGNEDWSSLDLITLEESLNIKRLSDSSKENTIEQLENEKEQLQIEKELLEKKHEQEKERILSEIKEQLRIQHQKEKELLQLELQAEKDRLKKELENERIERAFLLKEKEDKDNEERKELEILEKIRQEEKIKAENERLDLLRNLEEQKSSQELLAEQLRLQRVEEEKQRLEEEKSKLIAEQLRLQRVEEEKQRLEEEKQRLQEEKTRHEQERIKLLEKIEEERLLMLQAVEEEKEKMRKEKLELNNHNEEKNKQQIVDSNENQSLYQDSKSQRVKRKSILAAIVDHEEKLDEAKEKERVRNKSSELEEKESARLVQETRALENQENERIKASIAAFEDQERERVRKMTLELEEAEKERIRVAVAEREAMEKERVRLAALELEAKEKERVRLAALAMEEQEGEKLRNEARLLEEQEREKLRLEARALEEAEKERIRQAALAIEEAEKERVRLAAAAIEEAEKERVKLALLAIEEEEKRRISVMIEGENSKLEALQSQNRLKASRDKTRLKSVVISTKQLQIEQAAEKAAKERSELDAALQQRWKKQSELMEREAEEAAQRKREHDLLLESALGDIEQKREMKRSSMIATSSKTSSSNIQTKVSGTKTANDIEFPKIVNINEQRDTSIEVSNIDTSHNDSTNTISGASTNIESNPVVNSVSTTSTKSNNMGPTTVTPIAGLVIKTVDRKTSKKVFINVTHHDDIKYDSSTLIRHGTDLHKLIHVCELDETMDQSGSMSFVLDIIIFTDYFNIIKSSFSDNESRLGILIINDVKACTKLDLDDDFKLPKITSNYKTSTKHESPPTVTMPLFDKVAAIDKNEIIKRNSGNSRKQEIVNFATAAEKRDWSHFIEVNEELVATGLIGKKNPIGLTHKRQLILALKTDTTDGKITPRLFYVDPATMTWKGEITFIDIKEYASRQTKTVASVTDTQNEIFEIETIGRIYSFKDLSPRDDKKGAPWWANVINIIAKKYL